MGPENKINRITPHRKRRIHDRKIKPVVLIIATLGLFISFGYLLITALGVIDYMSGISYATIHGYGDFLQVGLDFYLIALGIELVFLLFFIWLFKKGRGR